MAEPAVRLEPEEELARDLARLRTLVETSDIEGARAYVKELLVKWPEERQVAKWARVLAPPRVIGTQPGRGYSVRPSEKEWLAGHAQEYPGCWIAVDDGRLIGADPSLDVVLEAVQRDGTPDPYLRFQPDPKKWP